jgi:hypothetical protein
MKNGAKGGLFGLALLLSLAVHIFAIASIRGFSFPHFSAPTVFTARLLPESPGKTGGTAAHTGTLLKALSSKSSDGASGSAASQSSQRDEETPGRTEDLPDDSAAQGGMPPPDGVAAAHPVKEAKLPAEPEPAEPVTSTPENRAKQTEEQPKTFRELLNFEIYWLGIYVGRAALEATISGADVTITSEAHSAAFISNFYTVEDRAESRIVNGSPERFTIRQREGKYRSNKETLFDLRNGKVTYVDHLKDLRQEHTSPPALLWDVISGFYYLRTLTLEVGKTVHINVFDSGKLLNVEVSVLGREQLDVPGKGMTDTLIVKPVLKSDGLFQKKGDMLIWLIDDGSKIPVKVETEVPVGKVVAKLKGIKTSW